MTTGTDLALTARQQKLLDVRDNMTAGAGRPLAIVPTSFPEVQAMCDALARSGIVPAAYRERPQDMIIVVMSGAELGFPPMAALRLYHLIEGLPRLSSEGIGALVLASPLCEYLEFAESTELRATWVGKRVGRPEKSITWTMERAKRAGLSGKANWMKYPEAQLMARGRAELCRMVWPDVCAGILSTEEAEDGLIDVGAMRNAAPGPLPVAPAQVQVATIEPAKPAAAAPKARAGRMPIDAKATEAPTSRPTSDDSSSGATSTPAHSATSSTVAVSEQTATASSDSAPSVAEPRPTSSAPTSSSASTGSASPSTTAPSSSAAATSPATPGAAPEDDFYETDPVDAAPPAKSIAGYNAWLASCTNKAQCKSGKGEWISWARTPGSGIASGSAEATAMQTAYARRLAELPE